MRHRTLSLAVSAAAVAVVVALLVASHDSSTSAATAPQPGSAAAAATPPRLYSATPSAVAARLSCSRQSGADFPGAFDDARNHAVGPLVLVGGATSTDAETAREYHGNKFPLLVRAGHKVSVSARGDASIDYGQLGARRSITFVACSAAESQSSADGPVTFWSGFVRTPAPACVQLDVEVDGERASRRIELELGRRCAKPPPLRTCDQHVEGDKPSSTAARPGDIVVGPLRFTGLAGLISRRRFEINRNRRDYAIKAGVGVRVGVRATLSIGPRARSWASLNYAPRRPGQAQRLGNAVRLQACDADHPAFSYDGPVGPVTGFSGGFVLKHAGCVPLEVRVAGQPTVRRTVRFGVRRCR